MTDKEIISLVEESPEGGYEARALGHSIFTEAATYEDLKQMVQDAVVCHFEPEARPRLVTLLVMEDETLTAQLATDESGRGEGSYPAP